MQPRFRVGDVFQARKSEVWTAMYGGRQHVPKGTRATIAEAWEGCDVYRVAFGRVEWMPTEDNLLLHFERVR